MLAITGEIGELIAAPVCKIGCYRKNKWMLSSTLLMG